VITIKHIEALYWVHRLGSISAAAEKLHASQSAITKRISDLERSFAVSLIECTHRNAVLTAKGLEVYQLGKEMLKQRDLIVDTLSEKRALTGRYRIGVTELTAISWLTTFTNRFKSIYPGMVLEAEVNESPRLQEKLIEGSLDFAILDASFQDLRLALVPMYQVELAWMCRPGLVEAGRRYSLADLARFPLLSPGPTSGLALIYDRLFASHGLRQKATMTAPSLAALCTLTEAGYGICCLPLEHCRDLVRSGVLAIITMDHPSIRLEFAGMYRHDCLVGLAHSVTGIATQCLRTRNEPMLETAR
jgi:DNA-binding transcriptional LysR family regulator